MEIMSSLKEGYLSWLNSVAEINTLTIDQLNKLSDKQVDTLKGVSDIGVQYLRDAQSIQGVDGVKAYAGETINMTGVLAKKWMQDSQEVIAMNTEYKDKVVAVMKEGIKKPAPTKKSK